MTNNSPVHATHGRTVIAIAASLLFVASLVGMQRSRAALPRFALSGNASVLPAVVLASRSASVVAEQPGVLARLSVAPGDKIVPGQEIAVLENPALSLALAEARSRTTEASLRLDEARKPGLKDRLYSEQYKAAENTSKLTCARAGEFNLQQVQEAQRSAAAKLIEVQRLQQEHMATVAEVERYRQEERNALQSLLAAREVHSRLTQECETSRAQVEILKLQVDLERRNTLQLAQAHWENASAQEEAASKQLEALRIVSRQGGTVLSVSPARGEWIHGGSVIAQIGDVSELTVEVPVSGRIARLVKKGEVVVVRIPTDPPQDVEAPVNAVILSQKDVEHPYVIRVNIKNPDPDNVVAGLEGAVIFRHHFLPENSR